MAEKFGDTLIVAPIEPMEQGRLLGRHERLPLHITIQPWFQLPESERAFRNAFSNVMFTYEPFVVERGHFDIYGHNKKIDLIERGVGNLTELHQEIGETIVNFAGVLHPSLRTRPFQPHVTRVAGRSMPATVAVEAVQLVSRQADGSKLVGRLYPFGHYKPL